ncbi:MAG: endo-1,4-beta-xylanase [Mobilitalea sp.]
MFNKKKLLLLTMTLLVATAAFTGCGTKKAANDAIPTAAPVVEATPTVQPTAIPTAMPLPTQVPIDYDTAVIKDVWADYFYVGAVLNGGGVGTDTYKELVKTNFNSLTMENEMKPDAILDWATSKSDPDKYNESPAISFSRAEAGLKFAQENGLKMRGHTLVWHSQTPKWFFTEGYSSDADAKFVSRELMLKRMENYIRQVMEYVQTNYPDLIYAWDVVNEAIQPSDGQEDGLRTETSMWYQVVGADYIEKAFEYARKYAAPGVKLFYNDYNTEESAKVVAIKKLAKKLIEQGTIDGIGMQTHISMDNPSLSTIDSSVRAYAELDLELQVTELDVGLESNTEEDFLDQATRYKRLFLYFKKWKEDGIKLTSVTFWGTTDNKSWLNKSNLPSYPLLFNDKLEKKPAYFGVMQDPDIPLY